MNSKQGYVTLESIELRKAALEAAGWEIRKDYGPYQVWAAYMPNDQVYFVEFSETRVLEGCPAVESSVDAALEYLTLPDGLYFVMESITKGVKFGSPAYAAIRDINNPINIKPLAQAYDEESLAVAMCRTYLQYKGGA